MNCWYCRTELIWGGDIDLSPEDDGYIMETNLSCPNCKAEVLVYMPEPEEE